MENILLHIEAIIFTAKEAVSVKEIQVALEKQSDEAITSSFIEVQIEELMQKYASNIYAFELVRIGSGYQFLTKSAYHKSISLYLNQKNKRRLSAAALETLAIIAYKQPVTKAEMEQIRGVNCDYSVQKLLEKELVAIIGRSSLPGRPLLYGTSQLFMDYFGINSTKDLPKLKDIAVEDNEVGVRESGD